MAGESRHDKTEGGRQSRPRYEQLPLRQTGPYPGSAGPEGSAAPGGPGEKEGLLACLFAACGDGIFLYEIPAGGHIGRWIDVNDRLCRMLGYAREELLEQTGLDLVGAEAKAALVPHLAGSHRSGGMPFETTFIRKDRQPLPVEVSIGARQLQGRCLILSIVRDSSARRCREESLRQGRECLEEELRTQTQELREMADRLQQEVQESQGHARQLRKMTRELYEAEDRERRHLAEILHDDLQQILAAAKFHLGLLPGRGRSEAESAEIVEQIKGMLQDAIDKSRGLSHELGPAVLSQGGLDDAFAWLADQMQSKHGLVVHVQTRGRVESSSEPVRSFLYRAAREILFNVVKHAGVSEAKLRLRRVRNQLWLTISDRGRGFDRHALAGSAGFGLLNVRERAELLGGRMKIRSTLGRGSTFLIAVPDADPPTERA